MKKLLFNNIAKSYRKSTERLEKAINMKAKHVSKSWNWTAVSNALQKTLRLYC